MRDSDTEYIKRMGDRIAELERDRQMYVNSSDRLTAQVKELEATISEKDKCLYELEDEIIRLQPIIDAENKRIAELETALREIQDHCAGKTGSLQAVVVVIARKALEGK
jgi:chromosome segregation ATPase